MFTTIPPVDIIPIICSGLWLLDSLNLLSTCKSYALDVTDAVEPRTLFKMAMDENLDGIAIRVMNRFPEIFEEGDIIQDIRIAVILRKTDITIALIDKFLDPREHHLWGLMECANECDNAVILVKIAMLIYTEKPPGAYCGELTLDSIILNRIRENDFAFCHRIVDILHRDENQKMAFSPHWIMDNIVDEEVFDELYNSNLWEIDHGYLSARYGWEYSEESDSDEE